MRNLSDKEKWQEQAEELREKFGFNEARAYPHNTEIITTRQAILDYRRHDYLPTISLDTGMGAERYKYQRNENEGRVELMERSLDNKTKKEGKVVLSYHYCLYVLPPDTIITEHNEELILTRIQKS